MSILVFIASLGLTGCDDFSVIAQFEANAGLGLLIQKGEVVPGETIELYPSGGYEPYSYGIVTEQLVYGSSPGSIADHHYTAATSIGDVRIYLFDKKDSSVSEVVTILPPTPENFSANGATGNNATINLSWNWSLSEELISGFQIYRSTDGGPFELIASPASSARSFTDSGNPDVPYSYRLYAVTDNYVSNPTLEKTAQTNPP